jgi:hypothetical protein
MNTPAALTVDSPELPSIADRLEQELLACDDFATWCDERADASRDAFDAEQVSL